MEVLKLLVSRLCSQLFVRFVAGALVWLVATLGWVPLGHAAPALEYSKIDRATVRVFSLKGVALEDVDTGNSGETRPVAIPDGGHGSGLVVNDEGLILTAKHVVEDARILAVLLPGADSAVAARIVSMDPERDIAWLAVNDAPADFVSLPAEPPTLAVRSSIFVIGYPLDAARTDPQSQYGVISGSLPDGSLQLGVALNPGNSGGPVVGTGETVVGIAVARADPMQGAQGIGVAVPMSHILPSLAQLRKSGAFQNTRRILAADADKDRVRATILTTLMTSGSTAKSLGIGENKPGSENQQFWEELKGAVRKVGKQSPELILLASARHFNHALWNTKSGTMVRRQWLNKARALVRTALKYDASLEKGSKFIALLLHGERNLGRSDATDSPLRAATVNVADDDSTESGDDSTEFGDDSTEFGDDSTEFGDDSTEFGDDEDAREDDENNRLQVLQRIPSFAMGAFWNVGHNAQLVGAGVSGWLYAADAFHLAYRYSLGAMLLGRDWPLTHEADVLAGIPIYTHRDVTTTRLVLDVEHQYNVTRITYRKAKVTAMTAVLLEVGGIVSPVAYHRCGAVCQADFTTDYPIGVAHVISPAVGIRYRYFFDADSPELARSARQAVDLGLLALAMHWGTPDGDVYSTIDDESLDQADIGFRASAAGILSPWLNVVNTIAFGILPANGRWFGTLGMGYHFY